MTDFSTYQSPFSWRYGSAEMRRLLSEEYKYRLWRRIWVALAEVESEAGLVSPEELADLRRHQDDIDIERILEIERETRHDVAAAIREYAEKATVGGGKIHLGATSMDITDNADMLRLREGLALIRKRLADSLALLADKVDQYADLPTLGFTHLQPAEPTTVGYRLAGYGQDLLADLGNLQFVAESIKAKGMKGAVGTGASYRAMLKGKSITAEELDRMVMERLGVSAALISTQVYPRKYDYLLLTALAGLAASLAKFSADLRILQSPTFGEWSEPFGKNQVGSSAMPFKKNPINAEKIGSLARYVAGLPTVAWGNASHSYLERTLDDSANRRVILMEGLLAADEMLITFHTIISGLAINTAQTGRNLARYAPFAATEAVMIAAVKKGANRQEMHELMREEALRAWTAIQDGEENPLAERLAANKRLSVYLSPVELARLFKVDDHIGTAPGRARRLSAAIRKAISKQPL